MNIRQLEIFWAIMRTGSVTGAARSLGVSQPAVSRILRHTEDQLKMKLFIRKSGRLHPTEEAKQLFVLAESVFDNVTKLRQAALDFRDNLSGRIQIAATPDLAATFLPSPLARFMRERPRVELSVKVLTASQVLNRVSLHQADIGVLYGPVSEPSVQALDLAAANLVCLLREDHPLAARSVIGPQDLAEERIISFHRNTMTGTRIRDVLWKVLPDKAISFECDHSIVAMSIVQANVGVAVLPLLLPASELPPGIVERPFEPVVSIVPQLVHRRSPAISRLTEALLKALQDFAAERRTDPVGSAS